MVHLVSLNKFNDTVVAPPKLYPAKFQSLLFKSVILLLSMFTLKYVLNAIADARTQGLRVVQLLGHDDLSSVPYATHQMVLQNGQWVIEKI